MDMRDYKRYKAFTEYLYRAIIIAWVVMIATLLIAAIMLMSDKPKNAEAATEPATESVKLIIEERNERVEERDDAIDLASLKQIETAAITAYDICYKCCGKTPDHPAYGITASGRRAEPYVSVAVDPSIIPLGSTVYLDYGDGVLHEFRADDTGSGVKGSHIDVCYPDHQSALEFGIKTAKVYWKEVGHETHAV